MRKIKHKFYFLLLVLLPIIGTQLTGCATYGNGVDKALKAAKQGDYIQAEQDMSDALSPVGTDRLLYFVEMAVLKHLQRDYVESNRLLTLAEKTSEELEITSVSDSLTAFMTNPRMGEYSGADFEKVFINYYKAMNYIAISNIAATRNERLDAIESARIESRRLGIRLNALNSDKGTYSEQKVKDGEMFTQLLDVFDMLIGNSIDHDKLLYRDDAMAHYLTGITYESNGEYDDARISYQKAATSYEEGFAEQFDLGSEMTVQAWFDTVRMMRKAGGYSSEWPRLAEKKLTAAQRGQLSEFDGKSQVVVIEHVGMVPQRKEMNVNLSANPETHSLILRPYALGSAKQNQEKLAWFYLVYADKSLVNLMIHYRNNDFMNFLLNNFQKTIYLLGAWNTAQELGLINAIAGGLRITVPYYSPLHDKPGPSFVHVDKKQYDMAPASSPAVMGINEQMLNANDDIRLALTRGIFKAITAQKTAELVGGQFGGILAQIGQVASQLTDAAETRNWLMLPHEIRITRIPLSSGSYTLDINSQVLKAQAPIKQSQKIILQENEIQVVQVRSMPHLKKVSTLPLQNKTLKSVALTE
jgi:hypothetical protein